MWTDFIYGFMAGLAATPHCLGMCGGFPLHLARSSHKGGVLWRQLLFIVGKSFTYVFLGTIAAAFGAILLKNTSAAPFAPVLRLAAGLLTVLLGLLMLGLRIPHTKFLKWTAGTGFIKSLYNGILSAPGPVGAFVLGLGVGFLPCPLPMAMLAIAAISHHLPSAMVLMAGVGLGTAPGLLAVGVFGVGLDRKFARTGMKFAGVMVLAVGLLTIGRVSGVVQARSSINKVIPSCCGSVEK